jgi:vancomycin resistance protein YoaR
VVLAVALLGGTGVFAWQLARFEQRRLTLDGVELPHGDAEPFVRALAADWYATEVTLDAGSRVVRATRHELGGRLDVERAVREVRAARGSAPIWERVWAIATGESGRFTFAREVQADATHAFMERLREHATVEPVASAGEGEGGEPGVTLNLLGSDAAIAEALAEDDVFVSLPVVRLEPPVHTRRSLRSARFDAIVSERETRYASTGELSGRANNIELAARHLDGTLIEPHGELSFNEIVGERTYARGFSPAVELTGGGRRTEGIGGGICQVAATLHAAAFFAGFEILEHHPHTRESSYIEPGLDSAVSWPNKDLRIKNPYPFYVRLHVRAYRGALRVALMGARRAPNVEWSTRVLHRIHRGTETEQARGMPAGEIEVLDEGEDGSVIERTRTIHWDEGVVTQTVELRYPVVHRLVRAGPGGASP